MAPSPSSPPNGDVSEIRAADQPDRTKILPTLPKVIKQPLRAPLEAEHADHSGVRGGTSIDPR